MNKEIIKIRAGNPTWIRNPAEAELVRQIHDQWCRDNGYRIREKVIQYGRKHGRKMSKKRQSITI